MQSIQLADFDRDALRTQLRKMSDSDHGFFTTLPETLQHFAFRAKKPSQADQT